MPTLEAESHAATCCIKVGRGQANLSVSELHDHCLSGLRESLAVYALQGVELHDWTVGSGPRGL